MPLSERQKIQLERFLLDQSQKQGSRKKLAVPYLLRHPQNKNKKKVLVGDIVREVKPRFVWYSRHVLTRNGNDSLTKDEINETIRKGRYLENRNSYICTKYGKRCTDRGEIAPMTNTAPCPKRRLADGNKTVVLSFCYPREFLQSQWRPRVVTAYKK